MNEKPGKENGPAKKKHGGNRVILIVVATFLFFWLARVFFLFYNFHSNYIRNLNYVDTYQLIQLLDDAVWQYKLDVGTCPSSLQGLLENIDHAEKWDGPYLKPALPRDPWGNEFHYVFPGKHGEFDIYSLGSDGKEGDGKDGGRLSARNQAGDLGNWDVVDQRKEMDPSFYDFELVTWDGQIIRTADLRGKVVLVVNTATDDLFTPQYARLEEIYRKYHDRGFEILDFPDLRANPGNSYSTDSPFLSNQDASRTDEEIHAFRTSEYGVTFPQMAKPKSRSDWPAIYSALGPVKWYFTKYVVGRDGKVARCFGPDATFDPADTMDELERCIRSLLDVPAEEKRDGKLEIEAGGL